MRSADLFQPIVPAHARVLVLASGPSGAGPWPRHPGVPVIAVNGAIDALAWAPDYWFTLDPSPINRARYAAPRAGTRYVIAVDGDHGPDAKRPHMRQDFDATGAHLLLRRNGLTPSHDPRVIHVGNSGRGALQLALHLVHGMADARVGVLGVDASEDDYWHAPGKRSGDLSTLPALVARVRRAGVQIVFGDAGNSRITSHRRMAPAEVVEWLRE